MEVTKAGIREFRAGLAEFIASSAPVAVTSHGQTIAYFIPTHGQAEAAIASLQKASKTLDRLPAAKCVDADAVVAEFKTARKRLSASKTLTPVVEGRYQLFWQQNCDLDLRPGGALFGGLIPGSVSAAPMADRGPSEAERSKRTRGVRVKTVSDPRRVSVAPPAKLSRPIPKAQRSSPRPELNA